MYLKQCYRTPVVFSINNAYLLLFVTNAFVNFHLFWCHCFDLASESIKKWKIIIYNILNKYMHSIYIWLASVSAGSLFLFYYLLYFSCEHWILFSCLKHCKIMSRLNNILYFVLTSPGDFQFCLACAGRSWHPHSKWIRFGTINH